jgi:hypothetical protein
MDTGIPFAFWLYATQNFTKKKDAPVFSIYGSLLVWYLLLAPNKSEVVARSRYVGSNII